MPKKTSDKKSVSTTKNKKNKEVEKIVEEKTKKEVKIDYIEATGRRKTSVARVRLFVGKGEIVVNDKPASEYFRSVGKVAEQVIQKPFACVGRRNKFHASVKVHGGGINSQLGALLHGFARALDKHDRDAFHKPLKKQGLLTRDPRMKERRKYGLMGARKKKSSPKR